jgi:hypothetical protein
MGRGQGNNQVLAQYSRSVVYYRHGYEEQTRQERPVLRECGFVVIDNLDELQSGDQVLCRYSLLPFAKDLDREIRRRGAHLIHDADAHEYLADLRRWYADLRELTPTTFFAADQVQGNGPFFVKGATNSAKEDWDNCYAADRGDLDRVLAYFGAHPLLSQQPVCIRQFVPLANYGHHRQTGALITDEYRCFIADGRLLSAGFYWSEQLDQLAAQGIYPDPAAIPATLIATIAERVGDQARWFVADVARTATNDWIVIELNDATMSGLAGNDAAQLYQRLAARLADE